MNATIRYLCFVSRQPTALADFYMQVFGMEELGRTDEGVALTDGFYNLSIVGPSSAATPLGMSHVGVHVDSIEEVRQQLEVVSPSSEVAAEPDDVLHGEARIVDPNGFPVSLSTTAFHVPGDAERRLPAIRHVAMSVPNNDEVLAFYQRTFGFRETTTSRKVREVYSDVRRQVRFAGDGQTALAILLDPELARQFEPDHEPKLGLSHFGFLVDDLDGFVAGLPPGALKDRRPGDRPMAEYRATDPDGNPMDISQTKGYEVDVDVWARA